MIFIPLLGLFQVQTISSKPQYGNLSNLNQLQRTTISLETTRTSHPGYVLNETYSSNHLGGTETKFSELLHRGIFVDKTLLLEDLFDPKLNNLVPDTDADLILITAPKRFGKSVNMQMIKTFCEIEMSDDTALPIARDLNHVTNTPNYHIFTKQYEFGNLKISQKSEFMREHFGKHPVIFVNFKSCSGPVLNHTDSLKCCRKAVHDAFQFHKYLLKSAELQPGDKKYFEERYSRNSSYLNDDSRLPNGLRNLINYLYYHFKRNVLVLFDGYDWIVHNAMENADLGKIGEIFTPIEYTISDALTDNAQYELAVFTGISHLSLQSGLMSTLSPLSPYRFAREGRFSKHFGFTSEEVDELFRRKNFSLDASQINRAKNYYNGYSVDGVDIYSPHSIVRFLEEKKIAVFCGQQDRQTTYVYRILRSPAMKKIIYDLMNNKTFETENYGEIRSFGEVPVLRKIADGSATEPLSKPQIDTVLNYLLDVGYLKICSKILTRIHVALPNLEVRQDLMDSLNITNVTLGSVL